MGLLQRKSFHVLLNCLLADLLIVLRAVTGATRRCSAHISGSAHPFCCNTAAAASPETAAAAISFIAVSGRNGTSTDQTKFQLNSARRRQDSTPITGLAPVCSQATARGRLCAPTALYERRAPVYGVLQAFCRPQGQHGLVPAAHAPALAPGRRYDACLSEVRTHFPAAARTNAANSAAQAPSRGSRLSGCHCTPSTKTSPSASMASMIPSRARAVTVNPSGTFRIA